MSLPQSTYIVQRGWRILTPHEDKNDNYDDGDDDDDDDDHDGCKCGATSGLANFFICVSISAWKARGLL